MTETTNARALYEALLDHDGQRPYQAVVAPWLERAGRAGYRERIAVAGVHQPWWVEEDGQLLLRELYALRRVGDHLLLTDVPGYAALFGALGMTPFEEGVEDLEHEEREGDERFDPFLHEIVEVEQDEDRHAPIRLAGVRWPGLMLGGLLFGRAGVRVRAGAAHAERGVADRSPLYWTHRRAHRPALDLSHGWGSNSQWRTDLRLDYRTADGDLLNVAETGAVDGRPDLHPDHPGNLSPEERLLTPAERRELLRHRCLLRTPEAVAALTAASPQWDRDLFPYEWRLPADEA
ncbi:hypothetical protein [Kitasatospora sp. NPDC097643]|uniref:hypothetical protein n=1 Tax=Kitasatospora sp. NPDC097643 TaxID=3157230 RepID=UPI003326DC41